MARKPKGTITIFGCYEIDLDKQGALIRPAPIDTSAPGDYGADPLGDGTFRMVPSGDVVDYEERCRRLEKKGSR